MNIKKSLELLREIKDVAFATVDENNNPQVRIIDVMIVENESIYFVTARGKNFYKELINTGKVAITGLTKNYEAIRVTGKTYRVEEQKRWLDRIFEENPSMKDVYPGDSRYILDVFVVDEGELEYFNLGNVPPKREVFSLKGADVADKGFFITTKCVKCNKCKVNCPSRCISEGSPYFINQEFCLHCGLCYEICPVEAIVKRDSFE